MDICQLSVVIVTFGRPVLLKQCLNSIAVSKLPQYYEIILIVNGDDAGQAEKIAQNYTGLKIKVYLIGRMTNAAARNQAIGYSSGEIIYFLDDDVIVSENIFIDVLDKFKARQDVDVIGGPNLTPLNSSLFQRCCGYAFSSVFGAADMHSRYAAFGKDRPADDRLLILCNLSVRKTTLDAKKIMFAGDLVCAEENNLLYRLELEGCKMLYCPQLIVYHERRKNILSFITQVFRYGYGRFQHTCHMPGSLRVFHLLPSLFVLYLLLSLFWTTPISSLVFLIYILVDIYFAAYIAFRRKCLPAFIILPVIFMVEHLSYGCGFIYGIKDIRRCCKRRSS